MKLPIYNELTVDVTACWMEEGDAPAMQNEAMTFHEAMRAP